jgi:hypothetical protein
MKLAVNCYVHNVSYDEVEPLLAIIDGRDTPEQIYEGLNWTRKKTGRFSLFVPSRVRRRQCVRL